MFRHKSNPSPDAANNNTDNIVVEDTSVTDVPMIEHKEVSLKDVEALLEKNLKWSQIIYEQNRKINHKLMWSAIADWLRLLIIIIPIVLALWFLPPLIRQGIDTYGNLLKINNTGAVKVDQNSLEQLLKILPINTAQQEQLKAILK